MFNNVSAYKSTYIRTALEIEKNDGFKLQLGLIHKQNTDSLNQTDEVQNTDTREIR